MAGRLTSRRSFHHELFHLYQNQVIPAGAAGEGLYVPLFREGLATLVARRLNPEASDKAIFGLPETTPARVRTDLPRLAAVVRARLDSIQPRMTPPFS